MSEFRNGYPFRNVFPTFYRFITFVFVYFRFIDIFDVVRHRWARSHGAPASPFRIRRARSRARAYIRRWTKSLQFCTLPPCNYPIPQSSINIRCPRCITFLPRSSAVSAVLPRRGIPWASLAPSRMKISQSSWSLARLTSSMWRCVRVNNTDKLINKESERAASFCHFILLSLNEVEGKSATRMDHKVESLKNVYNEVTKGQILPQQRDTAIGIAIRWTGFIWIRISRKWLVRSSAIRGFVPIVADVADESPPGVGEFRLRRTDWNEFARDASRRSSLAREQRIILISGTRIIVQHRRAQRASARGTRRPRRATRGVRRRRRRRVACYLSRVQTRATRASARARSTSRASIKRNFRRACSNARAIGHARWRASDLAYNGLLHLAKKRDRDGDRDGEGGGGEGGGARGISVQIRYFQREAKRERDPLARRSNGDGDGDGDGAARIFLPPRARFMSETSSSVTSEKSNRLYALVERLERNR